MVKKFDSNAIRQEIADNVAKIEAIQQLSVEESRELSEDDVKIIDEIMQSVGEPAEDGKEATGLHADLVRAKKFEALVKQKAQPAIDKEQKKRQQETRVFSVKRPLRMRAFEQSENGYKAAESAGLWVMAMLFGNTRAGMQASQYLASQGIDVRQAQITTTDASGGYLTPTELSQAIIRTVDTHSAFVGLGRTFTMMSDKLTIPKRSSGLTVQYAAEGADITASDVTWGQVSLTADTRQTLTRVSNELQMEALIDVVDDLAFEIGQAFGERFDVEALTGDGSASFGSVTGLENETVASVTGAGTTYEALTLANFNSLIGSLGDKYHANATIVMSRQAYAQSVERLVAAQGGTTMAETEMGPTRRQFSGYPIVFTSKMPAEATGNTVAYFGDFRAGMAIGMNKQIEIASSEHSAFAANSTEVRGVFRYDMDFHDVGASGAFAKLVLA